MALCSAAKVSPVSRETHTLLGTLHTSSAAKTIDRIVDVFPAHQQPIARPILAEIASRLDFLDRVGLGYLTLDVSQCRPGPDQVIVDGGQLGLQSAQLGEFGQGCPAVCDLVQSRVQRLQIQQAPLTACIGFQDVPPVLSLMVAPMTKSHGSVRSVQM